MITVEISTIDQANKVKCISVLCSVAGLTIIESNETIEAVISGQVKLVEVKDNEHADRLCEFLKMEGARAAISKDHDSTD